jgi:hypothetical protein
MTHEIYDRAALVDLTDRLGYEAWLLEAIYKLSPEELFPTFPDGVIYPLGSSQPIFSAHMRANILIGDWRPGFLEAGAPLIFTTTFKLIDLLLEWILERNGHATSHRFAEKIRTLNGPLTYPPLLEARPWLNERLRALYEASEPLRGTIIHSRHFTSADGSLRVSASKKGSVGPEVHISPQELRVFATLALSVLRYIEGRWSLDFHKENFLRWHLDKLAHLHQRGLLGQMEPYKTTVRVFMPSDSPLQVDVAKVRQDLAMRYPDHSPVFDLRILGVREGVVIEAYMFPSEVLDQLANIADASQYRVTPPQDLDPRHYSASTGC